MTLRYVTMPKWGIEMQQGTLTEWHVAEGDSVEKGQLIALVETDKINNEMEADQAGVFHKILATEGDVKIVGELIAVMGESGASDDDVSDFIAKFEAPDTSIAGASGAAKSATPATKAPKSETSAISNADFDAVNISPAAKALAIELGISPNQIEGTGRKGRMSLQDVEQSAMKLGLTDDVATSEGHSEPKNDPIIETMSALRKTAARRLSEAKSTIPHFYLRVNVNFDAVLDAKKSYKSDKGEKISVNDILIKAVASALIKNPNVNVQLHGDDIYKYPHADIAVAVATERGLVTPVVKAADQKSIGEISRSVRDMASRARNGKLTHADMSPGTFTISNLGMFGVDQFDAIINPPQCAILAVGAASRRAVEVDGKPGFATMVSLSLSCDHRAIDGALGAAFLKSLKALLENPKTLLNK